MRNQKIYPPGYFLLAFISILAFIGMGIALGFSSYLFDKFHKKSFLELLTNSESNEIGFEDTLTIGCTNKTLGNETETYNDKTFLGTVCPDTGDICSVYNCGSDYTCIRELTDGSTCYEDEQCIQINGDGFACNKTNCTCYMIPVPECTLDSECGTIEWTGCLEKTCNSGTCEDVFSSGSNCATNENCDPDFECRNCTCVAINATTGCETDSDCGTIEWTECLTKQCNSSGICEDVFSGSSTCATTENCDPGFECENCTCVAVDDWFSWSPNLTDYNARWGAITVSNGTSAAQSSCRIEESFVRCRVVASIDGTISAGTGYSLEIANTDLPIVANTNVEGDGAVTIFEISGTGGATTDVIAPIVIKTIVTGNGPTGINIVFLINLIAATTGTSSTTHSLYGEFSYGT